MKTGRRRKKEPADQPSPPQPEPEPASKAAQPPPPAAARPSVRKPSVTGRPSPQPTRLRQAWLLIVVALVVFVCLALLLSRACQGPATPTTYLPATADGSWTTVVKVVAPQTESMERWRSDCEADPLCTVIPGTCEVREREDRYTEREVDDYDDYAYNIYYEETEGKLYEAAADDFVVTQLNERGDWWEGDQHIIAEEWLDTETCQYTSYTVWITDPQDEDYEIEVILSECEVWDHVIVMERVGEQDELCQTENAGDVVIQDTLMDRGSGAAVEWPGAVLPAGGRLEREFKGVVTFRADGTKHAVDVTDVDKYVRYLTVPYYLGIDEDGDVVDITDTAP